jgi:hypothetical protein
LVEFVKLEDLVYATRNSMKLLTDVLIAVWVC